MSAADRQYNAATRVYQDVERWKRDLLAAGWKSIRATVWESPDRQLYRGPYKAWCVMKGVPCELPQSSDADDAN